MNQGAWHGFIRVAEGGLVKAAVPCAPGEHALACVLGGPDLKTLFMVCTRKHLRPSALGDGCVRTLPVEVGAAVMPKEKRYCAGLC